jgi:phosphatidylserine decarboxylase
LEVFLLLIKFLHLIPKNAVSYATGSLMRLKLPRFAFNVLAQAFVKVFNIDMTQSEQPLSAFGTLEDVFTRRLKPGSRPIQGTLVSPADGILVVSKPAVASEAIQCKGNHYSLEELVFGAASKAGRSGFSAMAWYSTVYLAPHNYHRVHSPCSGTISKIRYIPGELWPVNKAAVKCVPQLFVQNERLVFDIELDGGGCLHVVMVGALNVGRMETPFIPNFATNDKIRLWRQAKKETFTIEPRRIEVGEELGVFMLGSTVILAFDEKAKQRFEIRQVEQDRVIMVGENL